MLLIQHISVIGGKCKNTNKSPSPQKKIPIVDKFSSPHSVTSPAGLTSPLKHPTKYPQP